MIRKTLKNSRFLLSLVGNFSLGARLVKQHKTRYPRFVSNLSSLVIEGFPRSGNSFFVAAFRYWNYGTEISHHTHLAGNVKEALRLGVPAVVLIRDPLEAVASVVAWDEQLSPAVGLLSYIHFYDRLWASRSGFLVIDFDSAIQRPDLCIQEINSMFDTNFSAKAISEVDRNVIMGRISARDKVLGRGARNTTAPNSQKDQIKDRIKSQLRESILMPKAMRAFERYQRISFKS